MVGVLTRCFPLISVHLARAVRMNHAHPPEKGSKVPGVFLFLQNLVECLLVNQPQLVLASEAAESQLSSGMRVLVDEDLRYEIVPVHYILWYVVDRIFEKKVIAVSIDAFVFPLLELHRIAGIAEPQLFTFRDVVELLPNQRLAME